MDERPFGRVFDPENGFWSALGRGVDIVGLSLAWAFLCIPVVTYGAATSALYYTIVKCVRQKEKNTFAVFWKAFKGNLKKCSIATLVCIPFAVAFVFGYSIMQANWGSPLGSVMFVAYDIALIIPIGIMCWMFPLMGRFDMGIKEGFRTSVMLCFRHLPSTVVVVLLTLEVFIFMIEKWWPIFFAPALWMLLTSLFFERIFPKYLSDEDQVLMELTSETPIDED